KIYIVQEPVEEVQEIYKPCKDINIGNKFTRTEHQQGNNNFHSHPEKQFPQKGVYAQGAPKYTATHDPHPGKQGAVARDHGREMEVVFYKEGGRHGKYHNHAVCK